MTKSRNNEISTFVISKSRKIEKNNTTMTIPRGIRNNNLSLCDTHNIPIATNLATAELLIKALERGDLDWRELYH